MEEKIQTLLNEFSSSPAFAKLEENSLYPVSHSDGTKSWFAFSVDRESACATLEMYLGEKALGSRLAFLSLSGSSGLREKLEAYHSLDCLLLSWMTGDAAGFQLTRLLPQRTERQADAQEKRYLLEALSAAMDSPAPALLPGTAEPPAYPAGVCTDPLLRSKIGKCPCSDIVWGAEIYLHVEPEMNGDTEEGGFYPYALTIAEEKSGTVYASCIAKAYNEYNEDFLQLFCALAEKEGKPGCLVTVDDRTEAFFRPLCEIFGIPLERRSESPGLSAARERYEEFFLGGTGEETEEADPGDDWDDDGDDSGWDSLNEMILAMSDNPAFLQRMDTELLTGLVQDMRDGLLDDSRMDGLLAELRRRESE